MSRQNATRPWHISGSALSSIESKLTTGDISYTSTQQWRRRGEPHATQFQYGAQVKSGQDEGRPVKKPTSWLSNSPAILRELGRRCNGQGGSCSRLRGGAHALCSGSTARQAAEYCPGICRAIIKGMAQQVRNDGLLQPGVVGLQALDDEHEVSTRPRRRVLWEIQRRHFQASPEG